MKIRFEGGGVHLPELGLWLDPATRQTGSERVFVSHAHSDHIRAHREVILTESTAYLMHARLGGKRQEHLLPFHQPATFSGGAKPYQITLLPAGHILGSAMALIEAGGESLLYTGDFKLNSSLAAEACTPRPADILITETTFGRPRYVFPPSQLVLSQMLEFCRDNLAKGITPVLMAYSLGKSQEILRGLLDLHAPIMINDQIRKMTRIYEHFGQHFPPYEKYEAAAAPGKVLLWPPGGMRFSTKPKIDLMRTAIFTGWALDSSCRYRYGTDAAFPLSDHSDYNELLEFVKRVSPKEIYTLHGFAADFAQTLRSQGHHAFALSEDEQLLMPF